MKVSDHSERGLRRRDGREGFTLVEVLVASTVGAIVLAGVIMAFVWALRAATESQEYARAQVMATKSSQRLIGLIRNAMAIQAIDISGDWVDLSMPTNGRVARIYYDNPPGEDNGRLLLRRDVTVTNVSPTILASSVSKVMTMPVRNIFEQTSQNSLRVAYRISRPGRHGEHPAEVDFGVQLRNR